MISVGHDRVSLTEGKNLGIDFADWLRTPTGTTTISGTPTVNGVNCTAAYVGVVGDVVEVSVVAAAGLARGARGEVRVELTLANGETPKRKIDLTFE